ncbi:Helix-turn-helix domain protein [Candidatus Norongarragalina meridionalis]|nr:Helix-turn-helix domain protein [Candidatus Norongarragalina meridionalis]
MADVVLDRESFRALSSETRVAILKKLMERRMTATELAKDLKITAQAASEHLRKMEKAGMVVPAKHSKWVYFELTEKGRAVLEPGTTKLFVLLAVSLIAVGWSTMRLFFTEHIAQGPVPAPIITGVEDAGRTLAATSAEKAANTFASQAPAGGFEAFILVLGAIGVGYALASIMRGRR